MCLFDHSGTGCTQRTEFARNPRGTGHLDVCEEHFDKIVNEILRANPTLSADEANDYAKIHCVIQDRALVNLALNALSDLLCAFSVKYRTMILISYDDFPPLHWLLKSVEERYGFERDCVMTGLLSSEAFLAQLLGMYVALDFGAGPDHGALTHRLQWFAVMWAASGGSLDGTQLAAWKTSLKDLWLGLGEGRTSQRTILPGSNRRGGEPGKCLWAAMFDLGGRGNFNHPDSMHAAIRNGTIGGTELKDAVLAIQQDVVNRSAVVLQKMLSKGTARYTDGGAGRLADRADLIAAAQTGRCLSNSFSFKSGGGLFRNSRWVHAGDETDDGTTFFEVIQSEGLKMLVKDLTRNRRWIPEHENLLVRSNPVMINDYLEI